MKKIDQSGNNNNKNATTSCPSSTTCVLDRRITTIHWPTYLLWFQLVMEFLTCWVLKSKVFGQWNCYIMWIAWGLQKFSSLKQSTRQFSIQNYLTRYVVLLQWNASVLNISLTKSPLLLPTCLCIHFHAIKVCKCGASDQKAQQ